MSAADDTLPTREPPLVSVAMAAYNAERFLDAALDSVLAQTYPRLEVVVCDDASTDATSARLAHRARRDPRVRVIRNQRNLGGYGAMNRAVAATKGEFVAVYHADDVYDPVIVEREVAFLRSHPQAGAVFCLDRFLDEGGREYRRLDVPATLREVRLFDGPALVDALLRYRNTFLRTPSVMFRRAAFDAVGGFDQERFGIQADVDLWVRLSERCPIGLVHEHLYGYRHYAAQWSRQYERLRTTRELFFDVMDRHLSRPGVRARASAEALARYEVWRVQDEAECAANKLILGDRHGAVALLNASAVRPLWRVRPLQVTRVLGLRTLVRLAAGMGGGGAARWVVYVGRFRRRPGQLAAGSPMAAQTLAGTGALRGAARPPVARVFLDPFTRHFYGNAIFDERSKLNRDDCLRPWRRLRDRLAASGVEIVTADYLADQTDGRLPQFYVSFGLRDRYRTLADRGRLRLAAFYLFEVVVVDPAMYREIPDLARTFRRVYSWSDPESLAPFTDGPVSVREFRIPAPQEAPIDALWSRRVRDGVVMISSNRRATLPTGELYTERLRALRGGLECGMPVDLWGTRWEQGLGDREAEFGAAVRRAYRGPTADKYETLSRYRFAICYENMVLRGWITEKLFDCFVAGTVPVYLGAPEITEWVPQEAFVDRRHFASDAELYRYLADLSTAEVARYREAARSYLASERFLPFTADAFADRFIGDLEAQLAEEGARAPWA